MRSPDEREERWLIHKDRLDYGPFSLLQVKASIAKGDLQGSHLIVDQETAERTRIYDHPLLSSFVREAEAHLEAERRAHADARMVRSEQRKSVAVGMVVLAVLVVVGGGVGLWYWRASQQKVAAAQRSDDLDLSKIEVSFTVSPGETTAKGGGGRRSARPAARRGPRNAGFDEVTDLGDASEGGGEERLSQAQIQSTLSSRFGLLKGCVVEERRRNASLRSVQMDFVVKGTGRVSGVRVNGEEQSPFARCMFGRMQQITFPSFRGASTRASFGMTLR